MSTTIGLGIGSCVFALLWRTTIVEEESEYRFYKSVRKVKQLKDLAQLLDNKKPLLVAISGRVGSETPIDCGGDAGLKAVVVMEKIERRFLVPHKKDNDTKNVEDWVQKSHVLSSRVREVPWYLVLGDVQIDRVLCVGKDLTVIGEAWKDDSGAVHIRRSRGYFLLSRSCSLDAAIAELEECVSFCKTGSDFLAVLGVGFIAVGVLSIIYRSFGVAE
ncbi:hypothetical protein Tsubulata_036758 [Turnera subulata]|uniref:RING-type E3 ubiquitin transferase n=1 Tax=Turnera subulata TaxID=218843 RepID=A0A9Q0JHV5_9ROSI|nr:hypothetical protein Tsubulata_036758 [Turnera subulata]